MKKLIVVLFLMGGCLSCLTQNIGIGLSNPSRAKLEINGAVGNTVGIFGGETAGIGIIANAPEIGFNIYYSGGTRYIGTGFGALQFLDHNTGYLCIDMYPSGVANAFPSSYFRALTISPNGNVGIGATAPLRKLQVQEGDIRIEKSAAFASGYLEFISKAAGENDVRFELFNGSFYTSVSDNDFASGRVDKTRVDVHNSSNYSFTVFGSAIASGGYWYDSDSALKKNIRNIDPVVELIKRIRPVSFEFEREKFINLGLADGKRFGFTAQNIETIFPSLVKSDKQPVRINEKGEREMQEVKAVNYLELIPILTRAIQEQQDEIEHLEKETGFLKEQNRLMMELLKKK